MIGALLKAALKRFSDHPDEPLEVRDTAIYAEENRAGVVRYALRDLVGVTAWHRVREHWEERTLVRVPLEILGGETPARAVARARQMRPLVSRALEDGYSGLIAYDMHSQSLVFAFDDGKQAMLFKLAHGGAA